jgi:hypothetical protein
MKNFKQYIEQYDDIVTSVTSDPMVYNVKTKKLGPGNYEVHTHKGIFRIEGGRYQNDDSNTRWNIYLPGEPDPDETLGTLRHAKEYIQFVLNDRQGDFF